MVPITVVIPESVAAAGNVKVTFVPAISVKTAPTVAELTATGSVDLSCYMMPDWSGITADQNKGEDRRFCSTESFDRLGTVKRSIGDLTYTYLPQTVGTDPGNKVYTALPKGTKGYLVVRYGLPAATTFVAAQKVDVIPVEMGARSKNPTGSDEFAPLVVVQGVGATGVVIEDALVA